MTFPNACSSESGRRSFWFLKSINLNLISSFPCTYAIVVEPHDQLITTTSPRSLIAQHLHRKRHTKHTKHTQDGRLSGTTTSYDHVARGWSADENTRWLRCREWPHSPILVHESKQAPFPIRPDWAFSSATRSNCPRQEGLIVKWSVFLGLMFLITLYITIGYIHAKRRMRKGLVPLAYHRVRSPNPSRLHQFLPSPSFSSSLNKGDMAC